MAYNTEKLTRLGELKALAERVKDDYATKKEVTALSNAIPAKVSELANDSKYQNEAQVAAAIKSAIASSGKAGFEKSQAVPSAADAEDNILYLVMNAKTGHYDIYAKVDGEVELLDDTTVDLSGYSTTEQVGDMLDGKVDKEAGKGLSSNDYTDADKQKLDGLSNYTHPAHDEKGIGLYKVSVDALGHVRAAEKVTKEDITAMGIPAQDTSYQAADAETDGLMSSADKAKLDSFHIATSEEVTELLDAVFGAQA